MRLLTVFLMMMPSFAQAQEALPPQPQTSTPPSDAAPAAPGIVSPSTASAVVAPPAQPIQPQPAYFPVLPPSRPCARPDTDGVWKLRRVYENPRGREAADFASQPHQYIYFARDDTYRTYKAVWADTSDAGVRTQLQSEKPAKLQQFLVHDSGFIYFYHDGVAVDVQACFIVANQKGEFRVGQMLLMPPEGQSPTRLLKMFENLDDIHKASQQAAPPPVAPPPRTRWRSPQ